jgi:hypothetical protein
MRRFFLGAVVSAAFVTVTPAMARTMHVTDGGIQMLVTDAPVLRRCVVVTSSGSYEADMAACQRAADTTPVNLLGLPTGTYLFPGSDRRYSDGTCVLPKRAQRPHDFASVCGAALASLGKARVATAIDAESWVRQSDIPATGAHVQVGIGVGTDGHATYCTIAHSTAQSGGTICQAILQRARFEPALNEAGEPMPFAYERAWQI